MGLDNHETEDYHQCPKCGRVLCTCPVDFTGSACSAKFYTGLDDFPYRNNEYSNRDYKFNRL